MALNGNDWPTVTNMQNVPLDCTFKLIVMSNYNPVWITRGFHKLRRHRLAGEPQLHRIIINGIGGTDDVGARIGSIMMRANGF